MHEKLPQLDRLCVTSVFDGKLWVQHSAYPGKSIPHIAETGFKETSKAFMLTGFALFNNFFVAQDTTKLQGMDMQLMSKMLKSSAHAPVILDGLASTVNFWSTQPKAFTQKETDLIKSWLHAVAQGTSRSV